ncbi:peptidase S8, partial [bacterium]|nr:peptidase S8 [bacterium]
MSLPEAALQGIANNPNIVLIEEDVERYPISILPSANAVSLPEQVVPYGVDMVQARDVWDTNRDGVVDAGAPTAANRKLCIIDSGLFTGHEDFQGLNVSGGYPSGWNSDGLGHGSHAAGTIAAINNSLGVIGVTPGTVQLYIVRVFGDDGAWVYSSTLIDAANRCAGAGANIISMSLGGTRSSITEKRGFASLYSQGILSIAAAGNDGNTAYSYPASYDSVMSVAAIDEAGLVADFSQQNDQVEIAAPGVGVLSTVPYIDETSVTVSGVSYSGGHVDYSARGTASGALVDGGLCDGSGAWAGKVVLCQRGTISFYDKVMNVQNSGGAAALIYNNVPGGFLGTLGDGYSSTIIGVSLSQEDGQYLVANRLGQTANVSSVLYTNVSGYEYYDGTSM